MNTAHPEGSSFCTESGDLPILTEVSSQSPAQIPGCRGPCGHMPRQLFSGLQPPSWSLPQQQKQQRDSAAILTGKTGGTQESCKPVSEVVGSTSYSHANATSWIQTLGGGQGQDRQDPRYREGEPEEKGACSLGPRGAALMPQIQCGQEDRPSKSSREKRTVSTRSHEPYSLICKKCSEKANPQGQKADGWCPGLRESLPVGTGLLSGMMKIFWDQTVQWSHYLPL